VGGSGSGAAGVRVARGGCLGRAFRLGGEKCGIGGDNGGRGISGSAVGGVGGMECAVLRGGEMLGWYVWVVV
jgi:hypothetical protein